MVGSYKINTASTSDDQAKLWIDPDPATFGAAVAPASTLSTSSGNDISANQLASFVFFRRGDANAAAQPAAMVADELKVAASWAGVTPSPITTATPPLLHFQKIEGKFVLFWSTNDSGFALQSTSVLFTNSIWQNVSGATGLVGSYFFFTNTVTNSSLYFRLRK